ncbi:hypothetical protein [Allobranchiibius sp. GilTou73]|uniref:ArsA family ATPase n=1 Tax=Allobranchiibius sp. GilTou73 TaxID=2904523 RepID=UPI001F4339CD|nr:hypothetical protein [Allobranchiibius sp. GilTou73]UIJ33602.1 hypothetical protein LVQ62_10510 [Allobranchiibius sp. GilTou73]
MGAQCVLVAGPGGTGCSTYAATLARAYADRGRSVLLLGTDPYDDATSLVDAPADGPLRTADPRDADDADGTMAPLLDMVGLDPRLAAEVARLTEAATVRLLWVIGAERSPGEVVVVDAGPRAVDLVRLAGAVPWILQRLAPAQRGWLTTSRPLLAAALGSRWPGEQVTDQVRAALVHASAAREVLIGEGSTAVVIAGSAPSAKVRRVVAGMALGGAPVNAVVGGPRSGPHDPPRWRTGRGVPDQLGALDDQARTGRLAGISWEHDGADYVWRMPLPGVRFRELRLSMMQDDLVLQTQGHRSVLTMPTALRRCRPVDARLHDGILTVRFSPVRQDEARDQG